MKKLIKTLAVITAVITAFAAVTAGIAFIAERIEEIKNKGKELRHKPYGIYERFIKRPLDCFLSTGALIVLSPVLTVTALLVRTKLGSPVLFTQDRPGRNEKIFKLYKFRTMTDERDENGEQLPDDVRLTKFGRALRKAIWLLLDRDRCLCSILNDIMNIKPEDMRFGQALQVMLR